MSLWGLGLLRIVFPDILHSEEWPTHVVSCLDCLEQHGFNWIAANRMHPFDRLFGGWEIVNTIGLAQRLLGVFGSGAAIGRAVVGAGCDSAHGCRGHR